MRSTERMVRAVGPTLVCLLAAGCGGMLDPVGREAARVATVWWVMFALASLVFVGVLVVAVLAVRSEPGEARSSTLGDHRLIIVGGIAVPAVVLSILLGMTLWAGDGVRSDGVEGALRIDVTGHQYWWDVRYPDADVRTANEIHLPVGQEVLLSLESNDVIHSVWIPQIAGKLDLIPGRTNRMTIRVDEAGVFRGVCAEYCGLQHAKMQLEVVAHPPEEFERWLQQSDREVETPREEELFAGWQVFMSSACVYCHRIDGTPAVSEFGPDLTDIASRRTLAAGMRPNNRGELSAWIVDPQGIKPGNHMPATRFDPDELQSLLDFLESLE